MTLEELYYVSQIVAVAMILASLIAIWLQMRQNHALARADAQRDLLKSIGTFLQMTLDNPRVLTDVRLGLQEYDTASAYLHVMEQAVYTKADKLITYPSFKGIETGALGIIVTPGGCQWWAHAKKIIGAAVSQHLDKRLAELGGVTPPFYELLTQFAPVDRSASAR